MIDKITPTDSRVQYKTARLNGVTYSYILAEPKGKPLHTIFLIHGWPDLSFGWRYQIPLLVSLGLRVIAPDMMGYGRTDAPDSPTFYTFKRASDDMAELAQQLGLSRIMLGGHDWGGAVVYRFAMHYPKLISAVISICTPFSTPQKKFVPATVLPNFKYQLQLAGPDVEANIVGEKKLRQFLNGIYGGRGSGDKPIFDTGHGLFFDRLEGVSPTPLLSEEEMDWYVKRYAIHGLHGPLNWYRTGKLNFEDERGLAEKVEGFKFDMPFLFIAGTRDAALPPRLSAGTDKWFRSLTRGEVDANHWALWEKPDEVNLYIKDFLVGQIGAGKPSL